MSTSSHEVLGLASAMSAACTERRTDVSSDGTKHCFVDTRGRCSVRACAQLRVLVVPHAVVAARRSRRTEFLFHDRRLRLTRTKSLRSLAFLLERSPVHDRMQEPRCAKLDNNFFLLSRAPVLSQRDAISKPRRGELKTHAVSGPSALSAHRADDLCADCYKRPHGQPMRSRRTVT